jgi:aminoglycoside 3-N-acetyltransferase
MAELNLIRFRSVLLELGLIDNPVIVHASLKAFGYIHGGGETVVRALSETTAGVLVPTFTYKTMITPDVGPPCNGLTYGSEQGLNAMAQPFHADMPADPLMGMLPESLRSRPEARRTLHPILSFAGIRVEDALDSQTMYNPLAPIGVLAERDGWVILMGTDHTVNSSIHYAEKLAGRRQFVRWALVKDRIVECPGFPGDSAGFGVIAGDLEAEARRVQLGPAWIQAFPLKRLFQVVLARLKKNSLDLLCARTDCERCNDIRQAS